MATIENFILRFRVEGQQAINQVSGAVQNVTNDIAAFAGANNNLGASLGALAGRLGPVGIAVGSVAAAMSGFGVKAVQLSAQINDLAGATKISSDVLLNLRTSIIAAGGTSEDMAAIVTRLNMSIAEAMAGNEKFQDSFRRLGVFVTDANGKVRSTDDILQDVISRFTDGKISAEELAAAYDLMGKTLSRIELERLQFRRDPALREQLDALDRMSERYDKLIDQIERGMVRAFGNLARAMEGGFITTVLYAIDRINDLIQYVLNIPTDAIASLLNLIPGVKINPVGLGDLYRKLAPQVYNPPPLPSETANATGTTGGRGGYGPESERLEKLRKELEGLSAAYQEQARVRVSNINLQGQLIGLSDREREIVQAQQQATNEFIAAQQKLIDRKDQLAEKDKELVSIIDQQIEANAKLYVQTYENIRNQITLNQENARSFEAGWNRAFGNYVDNMTNAATRAQNIFNALTRNMESAIDRFVETGKFSFSDFTRSVIADLLKIQLKAATVNLFRQLGGSGGGLFGSIAGLFRANGGNVNAGQPYIVGERGMELFVPRSSGTIVPNNQLGGGGGMTNVVYNISAVDADSFKTMLARDPSFLYAVTEQGRKSIPQTRR